MAARLRNEAGGLRNSQQVAVEHHLDPYIMPQPFPPVPKLQAGDGVLHELPLLRSGLQGPPVAAHDCSSHTAMVHTLHHKRKTKEQKSQNISTILLPCSL